VLPRFFGIGPLWSLVFFRVFVSWWYLFAPMFAAQRRLVGRLPAEHSVSGDLQP
jgi:hypothetical protein